MGALQTALTNLAAVSVSGVTSYPLDATPDSLTTAQLPALVLLPELSGESSGLEPNRFSAGDGCLQVQIAHVLLVAPVASGFGMRAHLPTLIALIDTYFAALAADPLLNGALSVGLRCGLRLGVTRYAGIEYHSATFLHTWILAL